MHTTPRGAWGHFWYANDASLFCEEKRNVFNEREKKSGNNACKGSAYNDDSKCGACRNTTTPPPFVMRATGGTTTTTRVFSQKSRFIFVPRFAEDETSSRRAHAAFAYVRRSRVIIRVVGFYLLYGFVVLLVEENCY